MVVPVAVLVLVTVRAAPACVVERVAYRPLRAAGRLAPVISALGVAFILQSLARNAYGASWRTYPPGIALTGGFDLGGGVRNGAMQIVVIVVCLLLMAGLYLLVIQRTRVGTAMRAVAIDPLVARRWASPTLTGSSRSSS